MRRSLSSRLLRFLKPWSRDMSSLSLVKSQSWAVMRSLGCSFMCKSVFMRLLLSGFLFFGELGTEKVV